MKRNLFNQYIKDGDFKNLFITEMGWNNFRGQAEMQPIVVDEVSYHMTTIAERSGFQVITCPVKAIPTTTVCKKIDLKLRRNAHDYICVYYIPGSEHQQWVAPVKNIDKRDLVTVEYETADKADFLFSKIDDLSFGLDERTTIVDVKERIQGTFAVNSEKITKDFYAGFKKEHKAFAEFITGIDDKIEIKKNRNKQWYTSVMLNRLMFCYFIQKKGFLNGDYDYLQNKLKWVQQEQGADRFFQTFYKGFLSHLFQDGLNAPKHDVEFERMYGRIPYLNGGMFDEHQLERDYKDIDISDEAFVRLFKFFDTWRWHLDTRITASGKDINPDVLGYIFEQYINDRAQMGAYYTKEDITEYIGKNCIIPFLMDKTAEASPKAFEPEGEIWQMMRESGDAYIYDAVKKGYDADWKNEIPEDIAVGIDTTQPDLLERRNKWNNKTEDRFALPTEIWRETVERLQRCDDLLGKIKSGSVTHINDFITYNLDIRSFVYDVLFRTKDHLLVRHFYKALQQVTILDPTCGSGAFLFAAMNILEPLYEVCIERMQEFNAQNPLWFKDELGEISHKYRSNIQYFIYKSIILRNLYGVDIMVEATEIAKLRLFLKMVAVVEVDRRADNLGLDPLPDIDFNIRCGNTLVGYATEEELNHDLEYGDMFELQEFKARVDQEMNLVARAYDIFKEVQFNQAEDMAKFKEAKKGLKDRLVSLNEVLNRKMYGVGNAKTYDEWLESHQPFHWLAEFYQIIKGNGGFDVIIGNPPYVEYNPLKFKYKILGVNKSSNLFALTIDRTRSLINAKGYFGMIVLMSFISTKRMQPLLKNFNENYSCKYFSSYEGTSNPGTLFNGVKAQLSILIASKSGKKCSYTTHYNRFFAPARSIIFKRLVYLDFNASVFPIPKTSNQIVFQIEKKIYEHNKIKDIFGSSCLFYRNMGNFFWKLVFKEEPLYKKNGKVEHSSTVSKIEQLDERVRDFYVCFYNSSLFFILWNTYSDCYHFKIDNSFFPFENFKMTDWKTLSDKLMKSFTKGGYIQSEIKSDGTTKEYFRYFPQSSKLLINEIDKELSKHYGFTEEELDFIINYDIKYRMGDELNENN